ncbi:hypothetical protein BLNAU_2177 [Blattamonas nauphoetae]|uniref:Uncharacterized protein n=1 Tax=Blattamonas nauphoetae TaxID=2049346 RepID=A0ABQ9YG55_9EUKA|nr:hypothetical protein BLNAU_2177 [Blattamonas nauphoetae]
MQKHSFNRHFLSSVADQPFHSANQNPPSKHTTPKKLTQFPSTIRIKSPEPESSDEYESPLSPWADNPPHLTSPIHRPPSEKLSDGVSDISPPLPLSSTSKHVTLGSLSSSSNSRILPDDDIEPVSPLGSQLSPPPRASLPLLSHRLQSSLFTSAPSMPASQRPTRFSQMLPPVTRKPGKMSQSQRYTPLSFGSPQSRKPESTQSSSFTSSLVSTESQLTPLDFRHSQLRFESQDETKLLSPVIDDALFSPDVSINSQTSRPTTFHPTPFPSIMESVNTQSIPDDLATPIKYTQIDPIETITPLTRTGFATPEQHLLHTVSPKEEKTLAEALTEFTEAVVIESDSESEDLMAIQSPIDTPHKDTHTSTLKSIKSPPAFFSESSSNRPIIISSSSNALESQSSSGMTDSGSPTGQYCLYSLAEEPSHFQFDSPTRRPRHTRNLVFLLPTFQRLDQPMSCRLQYFTSNQPVPVPFHQKHKSTFILYSSSIKEYPFLASFVANRRMSLWMVPQAEAKPIMLTSLAVDDYSSLLNTSTSLEPFMTHFVSHNIFLVFCRSFTIDEQIVVPMEKEPPHEEESRQNNHLDDEPILPMQALVADEAETHLRSEDDVISLLSNQDIPSQKNQTPESVRPNSLTSDERPSANTQSNNTSPTSPPSHNPPQPVAHFNPFSPNRYTHISQADHDYDSYIDLDTQPLRTQTLSLAAPKPLRQSRTSTRLDEQERDSDTSLYLSMSNKNRGGPQVFSDLSNNPYISQHAQRRHVSSFEIPDGAMIPPSSFGSNSTNTPYYSSQKSQHASQTQSSSQSQNTLTHSQLSRMTPHTYRAYHDKRKEKKNGVKSILVQFTDGIRYADIPLIARNKKDRPQHGRITSAMKAQFLKQMKEKSQLKQNSGSQSGTRGSASLETDQSTAAQSDSTETETQTDSSETPTLSDSTQTQTQSDSETSSDSTEEESDSGSRPTMLRDPPANSQDKNEGSGEQIEADESDQTEPSSVPSTPSKSPLSLVVFRLDGREPVLLGQGEVSIAKRPRLFHPLVSSITHETPHTVTISTAVSFCSHNLYFLRQTLQTVSQTPDLHHLEKIKLDPNATEISPSSLSLPKPKTKWRIQHRTEIAPNPAHSLPPSTHPKCKFTSPLTSLLLLEATNRVFQVIMPVKTLGIKRTPQKDIRRAPSLPKSVLGEDPECVCLAAVADKHLHLWLPLTTAGIVGPTSHRSVSIRSLVQLLQERSLASGVLKDTITLSPLPKLYTNLESGIVLHSSGNLMSRGHSFSLMLTGEIEDAPRLSRNEENAQKRKFSFLLPRMYSFKIGLTIVFCSNSFVQLELRHSSFTLHN